MLTKLAVIVGMLMLAQPGAAMSKVRAKRVKQGTTYRNPVATPAPQTGSQLAYGALADADKWWTSQGSAPPPLQLTFTPGSIDGQSHMGYAYYGTGRVDMAQPYVEKVARIVNDPHVTRSGKAAALAGLWTLAAHERGHDIGYEHQPAGLMAADAQMTSPAEAYQWAYRMVPSKKKVRRRGG